MMEGLDKLIRKLDSLGVTPDQYMPLAVGQGLTVVQGAAQDLAPKGEGELSGSIFTATESRQGYFEGEVYTNKAHAQYVELGAGPKGQASHAGISPNVSPSYSQTAWWIHESQIDKETAERYHFFKIETKDGIFYQSSGQAAQPFLYPALKDNEDSVIDVMGEVLQQQIRRALAK